MASRASAARGLLPWLFLAACLGGAGWALVSRREELADAFAQLTVASVAGSLVLGVAAVFAMLGSWVVAVREGGVDLPITDLARVYFVGQTGKYVPGSVWPVLAQAQLAKRRGSSPTLVAAGSLLNLGLSVTVCLAVGGALLPLTDHRAWEQLQWVPWVAVPMVLLLLPAVLNRALSVAGRVTRRAQVPYLVTGGGITRSAAWAVLGCLLFGGHLWFLVHALGGGGWRSFLLSTCAYALAVAAGVLVVFAPAGAGVRETVLILVLAPVLDVDKALAVALASRAVLIVVDVGLGASQVVGLRRWARTGAADAAADPAVDPAAVPPGAL